MAFLGLGTQIEQNVGTCCQCAQICVDDEDHLAWKRKFGAGMPEMSLELLCIGKLQLAHADVKQACQLSFSSFLGLKAVGLGGLSKQGQGKELRKHQERKRDLWCASTRILC